MSRIKNALMWLDEHGYEMTNENLHLVPEEIQPSIGFKLETIQDPFTQMWNVSVLSNDIPIIAVFTSLDKKLAVQYAADYIYYKSR